MKPGPERSQWQAEKQRNNLCKDVNQADGYKGTAEKQKVTLAEPETSLAFLSFLIFSTHTSSYPPIPLSRAYILIQRGI